MDRLVYFPTSTNVEQTEPALPARPSIVIVGANGSGKTRLGAWLETEGPQKDLVHRIPAQRNIRLPSSVSPVGLQAATDSFLWSDRPSNWDEQTWERNKHSQRLTSRYGGADSDSAATAPVSDFDRLLVLMFSENYTQLIKFQEMYDATNERIDSPETILKRAARVWNSVLTHREVVFGSGEVRARPLTEGADSYLASRMSDGERAVFYLIGNCLCARPGAIIVVDEPELHLHRSIQKKLWDALERERDDCQFVYVTHDIGFAESRTGSTKVWLKSADGRNFDWLQIADDEGVPAVVYLEVLGARRPVIFVEGVSGSVDLDVYSAVYPGFAVRPVGGCLDVISATKAFGRSIDFHHIECFGIVDRDYLTEDRMISYRRSNVWTPHVAEIENLFLLPEVLSLMASRLGVESSAIDDVKQSVFAEFERLKAEHALALTRRDLVMSLERFNGAGALADMSRGLSEAVAGLNVESIYLSHMSSAERILAESDYAGVLRVFNHKGLVGKVNRYFGLTRPSYLDRVRALLRKGDMDLVLALKSWLPSFDGRLTR